MKKETKKKLEIDLATAIEGVLAKYNSKAISKTKKTIKQAGKAVTKKFNKTVKAIMQQKEAAKVKKGTVRKSSVKKAAAVKPAKVKLPGTGKAVVTAAPPKVTAPVLSVADTGNPENL